MTVSSTISKAGPYTGNGVTTAFPFAFKVFTKADVQVVRATAAGVETVLVLDSDYSVSVNTNQTSNPGGTITYPISGSPLSAILTLTASGNVSYTQGTSLPVGGAFNAAVVEAALDRVTLLTQQLLEQVSRAVKVSISSGIDPTAYLTSIAASVTAAATSAAASAASAALSVANSANVTTVAGISANVTTVAGISANVTTVAGIAPNVTTVAGISADVTAVKNNAANVTAVAGNATNINAVVSNATNVNTVASISAAVSTVSTNIAAVVSAQTNLAAIIAAPTKAAEAAQSAADAANAVTNAIGVTVAGLATTETFTKAQRGAVLALTDAATITIDLALSNNFSVTLAGSRTLANPTNIVAGQSGVITITQDATGSRALAFGSVFKFASGAAIALTTAASSVDDLAYYVESSTRIVVKALGDAR